MQTTRASRWFAAVAIAAVSCGNSDGSSSVGNPSDEGGAGNGGQAGTGAEAGAAGAAEQFVVPRLGDCLAACAADHPDGRISLGTLTNTCACDECAKVCTGLCGGEHSMTAARTDA